MSLIYICMLPLSWARQKNCRFLLIYIQQQMFVCTWNTVSWGLKKKKSNSPEDGGNHFFKKFPYKKELGRKKLGWELSSLLHPFSSYSYLDGRVLSPLAIWRDIRHLPTTSSILSWCKCESDPSCIIPNDDWHCYISKVNHGCNLAMAWMWVASGPTGWDSKGDIFYQDFNFTENTMWV